ncbi:MAG: hypothetical protein AAB373_03380 [Patescibacteria group bacterium]
MSIVKQCIQCSEKFEVTDYDLAFLDKISPSFSGKKYLIPEPNLCAQCRQQQRISWRKERNLYYRTCSNSNKKILSMYPQEAKFPVFDNDIWWGDSWSALDYGRDFDFSRPFFDQLMELRDQVPHFALAIAKTTMQNSDFCNQAGYLKDCYLIFNSDNSERCLYGKGVNRCFDCLDCYKTYECEACYECMNCYNCKFAVYLWDSQNSSESSFCSNLIGCSNCFFCTNLQNKKYCFLNKEYSPEEWKKLVDDIFKNFSLEQILDKFITFREQQPHKFMEERNTENCIGNYLMNCRDCEACFDCEYLEKSKYCFDLKKGDGVSYENYDLSAFGMGVNNCYQGVSFGYNNNHVLFGVDVWNSFDVYYSILCVNNCKNCFGCVGLKKAEYCILNKQFSKEEYEELVPKIIEHMRKDGARPGGQEWGEFFPAKFSPFAYNEVTAQEYFPLSKEEVLSHGWNWRDEDKNEYKSQTVEVPKDVNLADETICDQILACKATGKNYKIQKTELAFYKKMKLPVPEFCPDYRHLRRINLRNPRKLWERNCTKCSKVLQSTFSPEMKEKIYCGDCYLKVAF